MAKGPSLYNDLPSLDPAKKAGDDLNSAIQGALEDDHVVILDEKIKERLVTQEGEVPDTEPKEEAERIEAALARTGSRILEHETDRNGIRLLIFTKDETIPQSGSIAEKRILELADTFSEVHVVTLTMRAKDGHDTLRIADNVWVYNTQSTYWWKMGFDAYRIANEQLTFAGGFRADVILAEDPFESGVAACFIADRYERPFQVHVTDDFYDPAFKERDDHNSLRVFMANYVLKRVDCVRTKSTSLRNQIVGEYPELHDFTEVLPTYHNLSVWRDLTPAFSLRERYPHFKFIMLHVSAMQSRSHSIEVVSGVAPILKRYPTVGLVIVGNGPLRSALEKQVIGLGIQNQVEFEPTPNEVISHMKSANILIHLSEDPEEDETILQAAAVRLPMITNTEGLAGELFTEGESAFMCANADPTCVSMRINTFLNENESRARFGLNAQEIVFERIEQDYGAYLDAYRGSIERCMAVGS